MLVVFSPHAARSTAVLREVYLGFSREVTIVPFRLQDAPLGKGMNFLLGVVHWLDAMTPPLEKHLRTLADRDPLRELVKGDRMAQCQHWKPSNADATEMYTKPLRADG